MSGEDRQVMRGLSRQLVSVTDNTAAQTSIGITVIQCAVDK